MKGRKPLIHASMIRNFLPFCMALNSYMKKRKRSGDRKIPIQQKKENLCMSILNVEHLSHGFGDRAIFEDVSFRLLKGEHIGLVGANGEGKSTFMNIITGKLMPDEGKVEWAKNVRVGYLDQHTVLEKGMTIRDVLKSAFSWLYEMEERMNTIW